MIETNDYPFIVNDVLKHIEKVKQTTSDVSLVDIIFDYSFKNNIDPELVGDAISDDVYFKSFIEKDCKMRKIIIDEKDNEELGEW